MLDSKVVTVKMQVNNDTHNAESGEAELCTTDPQWMKYHPVQVKFAHSFPWLHPPVPSDLGLWCAARLQLWAGYVCAGFCLVELCGAVD